MFIFFAVDHRSHDALNLSTIPICRFVMDDGREATCASIPTTSDGKSHFSEFVWDCPIAADPDPAGLSRPSSTTTLNRTILIPQ